MILQTIEPMKRVYSNTRDGRSFLVSRSCAPVFPCSRYFRNKGAGERTFYTGMRESIGTLNSRSCEEMTKLWHVLRGEVEGGDCGRDMSLTPNRLPASILLHRARVTRGGNGEMASWPHPPDPPIHKQRTCDESHPTPHTYTLWHRSIETQNRKARARGIAKRMSNRNAGMQRKNQGTRECKGPQEHSKRAHKKSLTTVMTFAFPKHHMFTCLCRLNKQG